MKRSKQYLSLWVLIIIIIASLLYYKYYTYNVYTYKYVIHVKKYTTEQITDSSIYTFSSQGYNKIGVNQTNGKDSVFSYSINADKPLSDANKQSLLWGLENYYEYRFNTIETKYDSIILIYDVYQIDSHKVIVSRSRSPTKCWNYEFFKQWADD